MSDYIKREDAIQANVSQVEFCKSEGLDFSGKLHIDSIINNLKHIPAADVVERKHGKWEKVGEQMLINLETAREQYSALGYPHRKIFNLRCSSCRMVTMVDSSIAYKYCPHCGADMRGES